MFLQALLFSLASDSTTTPALAVRLEPSRSEVIIVAGPSHVPGVVGMDHATAYNQGGHDMPLLRFTWPVSGWVRGFRLVLRGEDGRILQNRLLHHFNVVNFSRKQLVDPVFERSIAMGQEAQEFLLPASVGARLEAGTPMALNVGWANESGEDLHGIMLELTVRYSPDNMLPRPRDVRPLVLDVGFKPGGPMSFDLLPGVTVHEREFLIPVDGRLLGIGGHLHEHGESIRLVEVATGKVLAWLRPKTDSAGRVVDISKRLFGVAGDGLRLRAGRRYRVVAVYSNSAGSTIKDGGMAVIAAAFMPDDPDRWPALDRTHPGVLTDIAKLEGRLRTRKD